MILEKRFHQVVLCHACNQAMHVGPGSGCAPTLICCENVRCEENGRLWQFNAFTGIGRRDEVATPAPASSTFCGNAPWNQRDYL